MKKIIVGLIKGRHVLPVENFIYNSSDIKDITDVDRMERLARYRLQCLALSTKQYEWYTIYDKVDNYDKVVFDFPSNAKVIIYVTGLTVALIATLNILKEYNAKVTLMHYNLITEDYFPQEVKW